MNATHGGQLMPASFLESQDAASLNVVPLTSTGYFPIVLLPVPWMLPSEL